MKVGALIPTRGDRPKFLEHALYLLSKQTQKPDFIEVVDDIPNSKQKDITYRYRVGCERLVNKGADVIIFWEDDDWYASNYIQTMIEYWCTCSRPKIFGVSYTIYYHLKIRKWLKQNHENRASAMNTLVTKDIVNFDWPDDSESFVDLQLWKRIKGRAIQLTTIKSIGVKHGVGLCGGGGHKNTMWYKNNDPGMKWLAAHVDPKSFNFYADISNSSI